MTTKTSYDFRYHIHNVKDYECGGIIFNKKNGILIAEKDNIKVEIPLSEFDLLISKMDGKAKFDKQVFEIPKKKVRESDVFVHLKDKNGNTTISEPIQSIHYNSTMHVHLIEYMKNIQDYIVIGYSKAKQEICFSIGGINLDSFEKIEKDFTIYGNISDSKFPKLCSDIGEMVDYFTKNTNDKILLHDVELMEKILGYKFSNNVIDFKDYYDYDKYIEYTKAKTQISFDRSNQNVVYYSIFYKEMLGNNGKSNSLNIIVDRVKELEDKQANIKKTNSSPIKLGEYILKEINEK